MKKIMSSLLSLVMVFSLSVPAFAAESNSSTPDDTITVTQKIYFDEAVPATSANDQDTLYIKQLTKPTLIFLQFLLLLLLTLSGLPSKELLLNCPRMESLGRCRSLLSGK